MTGPIAFTPEHPLLIRPKDPIGFTIETADGTVIATCDVPFEHAQFQLRPIGSDQVAVVLEVTWLELPLSAGETPEDPA